ncbi:hypothetical protein Theba_2036 [Mesotoga prima MesG1.Ag.4.2]|uniref:Uncharacterized protein n=1 Tax=Mesotoga prima MesG1.Ag.4.2 TaxID=660470 RepID=I2F6X5_9BACT|nr:hypothetical protein [Mesotoga sp. H07pep.5.4]AFK07678.1 hypothetical protein Theba_2036 [Mesotoga prima MesG1.Ag.4.2]RLL84322.1 hypothetical protein Y696_07495 [Mesotoga sp. H07pep.5.4]
MIIVKHSCMLEFTRELKRSHKPLPNPVKTGMICNRKYVLLTLPVRVIKLPKTVQFGFNTISVSEIDPEFKPAPQSQMNPMISEGVKA